ncbi:transposase [Heyndrickxia ginsengihumi]|uniref:RNA-guided endonuclease InsQ/TnpB family protein n=1 Tax=Heyndrickxia ginsengihumi TaxID=363870 RepID=UPI003D216D9F
MKLTHKFKIPYDIDLYNKLKTKRLEAGKVWSDIVLYGNEYYRIFKNWISKSDLEKITSQRVWSDIVLYGNEYYRIFKHRIPMSDLEKVSSQIKYELHSQTVQAIVAKYDTAREITRKKQMSGDTNAKYPWKEKKYYTLPYKQAGMIVSEQTVVLKHYRYEMDFKRNKMKRINDYIEIPNLAQEDISNISYAEIAYKNGFYWFHYGISVQKKEPFRVFKPAGCDLGEIHSLAIATEDKALIISGRAIRAIKQYRDKVLAELSKEMSRLKKGSRKWEKYNRASQEVKAKCRQQIDYLIHKSTKMVIDFLIKENVSDLVIGDPMGIEKGTKSDPEKRVKKVRRQQLSKWSYGEFKKILKYKCELKGIKVHFVSENFTSQDCPFCDGRHIVNGRRFICNVTNSEIHRDVNGAQNICRKKFELAVKSVDVLFKQPMWLRKK